jgi:hypothetical protein
MYHISIVFISDSDNPYLLEVSRYIHNNPVKAGIVEKPEEVFSLDIIDTSKISSEQSGSNVLF